MCYRQIRLPNPTRHYRPGFDKPEIMVPCGKCSHCRQQYRDDWFVRAYCEAQSTWKKGGKVVFITLTYNENCLPHFNTTWHDLKGKHTIKDLPCFCKKDIDSFRSKFRTYMQREFNTAADFRFLVTSEYGKTTQRPHYHALLYLPAPFGLVADWKLKEIINKSWTFGFVLYSPESKGGISVNNEKGIKYVCKYVVKDVDYYDIPQVKEYFDYLKKSTSADVKERLREFRAVCPRHYQSINFGAEILGQIVSNVRNFDEVLQNGFRPFQSLKRYSLPRYILNKLCYNTNWEDIRVLNKFGIECMFRVWQINCKRKAKTYATLTTPEGVNALLSDSSISELGLPYKSGVDFANRFKYLLGKRSTMHLAVFDTLFYGKKACIYHHLLDSLDCPDIDYMCNSAPIIYKYTLDRSGLEDLATAPKGEPGLCKSKAFREKELSFTFDNLDVFKGFAEFLRLYDILRSRSLEIRMAAKQAAEYNNNKLKSLIFNFHSHG